MAALDPETGKVLAQPVKTILRNEGRNSAPDWSPDGDMLACRTSGSSVEPGRAALFLHSLRTGETRELTLKKTGGLNYHFLRWSPDGRRLLCVGRTRRAPTAPSMRSTPGPGTPRSSPVLTTAVYLRLRLGPRRQERLFLPARKGRTRPDPARTGDGNGEGAVQVPELRLLQVRALGRRPGGGFYHSEQAERLFDDRRRAPGPGRGQGHQRDDLDKGREIHPVRPVAQGHQEHQRPLARPGDRRRTKSWRWG